MIRKGNINENRTFGKLYLVICAVLVIGWIYPVEASGPPRAIISCNGCTGFQQISAAGYAASVPVGTQITLSGNSGYRSYAWYENGVLLPVNTRTITRNVNKNTQYTLTVVGPEGFDTRSIQISVIMPSGNIGLPDLSNIALDPDLGRTHFAVGDKFSVETGYDPNDFSNINFYWEVSDGSCLLVSDKSSAKTWITVVCRPSAGKNPEISAVVTNGISSNKKTVQIIIVDNTPPTVKNRYTYTMPLSHAEFQVSCSDCWTGSDYNENSDFLSEFTATLLDAENRAISSRTATAKRGQTFASVTLKAGDEGKYYLKVTVKDSHGLLSAVVDPIFVGFGNTEDDAPYIPINDTMSCDKGEPCPFDISKMNTHDLGVSIYFSDIIDITNPTTSETEPLFNTYRNQCRSFNCTTVFSNVGSRLIKITAQYMRGGKPSGKISEKIVTVFVREKGAQIPAQTPQKTKPAISPAATISRPLTPQPPPEVPAKPTPGLNPVAIFVAFAAAIFLRRRRFKH
jgi:hypothetical protein